MKRYYIILLLISTLTASTLFGAVPGKILVNHFKMDQPDSLKESQILYNGQLWRNIYLRVKDNQFLFSNEFLPGTVSINQKTFYNLFIKYDVFEDELLTSALTGATIKLNKEMIDSFSIFFQGKPYYFVKIESEKVKGFSGYVNVLCEGRGSLYVKYKKEIDNLAVDDKFDLFFQTHRIYFEKEGSVTVINGKRDMLNLMDDNKLKIKEYIKKNRLKISKNNPESFIPVIKFYNNLSY